MRKKGPPSPRPNPISWLNWGCTNGCTDRDAGRRYQLFTGRQRGCGFYLRHNGQSHSKGLIRQKSPHRNEYSRNKMAKTFLVA